MKLPIITGQEILIDTDGKVEFYSGALGNTHHLFQEIEMHSRFKQNVIHIWGKDHMVPRLESWHGSLSYTYSGMEMTPQPWYPTLWQIKLRVEELTGEQFNSCLINYYRNGEDYINFHADDERELGMTPTIASVSLGASRKFVLRRKDDHREKKEILLHDGDVLVMKGELQSHWEHGLPKMLRVKEPRINITFRFIHGSKT